MIRLAVSGQILYIALSWVLDQNEKATDIILLIAFSFLEKD